MVLDLFSAQREWKVLSLELQWEVAFVTSGRIKAQDGNSVSARVPEGFLEYPSSFGDDLLRRTEAAVVVTSCLPFVPTMFVQRDGSTGVTMDHEYELAYCVYTFGGMQVQMELGVNDAYVSFNSLHHTAVTSIYMAKDQSREQRYKAGLWAVRGDETAEVCTRTIAGAGAAVGAFIYLFGGLPDADTLLEGKLNFESRVCRLNLLRGEWEEMPPLPYPMGFLVTLPGKPRLLPSFFLFPS